jgi:hypothetical protein
LPHVGPDVPDPVYVHHGDLRERLIFGNCLHPPTLVLRRDAAARAGPLDRTYGANVDWEYLLRVARQGPVAYVDHPLMWYRYAPGQMSSDRHLAAVNTSLLLVLERLAMREPALLASLRLAGAGPETARTIARLCLPAALVRWVRARRHGGPGGPASAPHPPWARRRAVQGSGTVTGERARRAAP